MDETRRRILEDALVLYQDFLKEDSTDPTARQETAKAYHQAAKIYKALGRAEQSEGAWRQAAAMQGALAADFPDVPAYRRDWAASLANLGPLLQGAGNVAEAEAAYLRARAI